MPRYLYMFGFHTPAQIEGWEKHRWDDENSEAVFIEAPSEDEALTWGREVSREFVHRLYASQGLIWKHTDYANWIESRPETTCAQQDLARIQIVRVGQHPLLDGYRIAQRDETNAA